MEKDIYLSSAVFANWLSEDDIHQSVNGVRFENMCTVWLKKMPFLLFVFEVQTILHCIWQISPPFNPTLSDETEAAWRNIFS